MLLTDICTEGISGLGKTPPLRINEQWRKSNDCSMEV